MASSSSGAKLERSIPDLHAQEQWRKTAQTLEPELWKALCTAGFNNVLCFDALSDLSLLELRDQLAAILGRQPIAGENFALRVLIEAASDHATKKRRHITLASRFPALREYVPQTILLSCREQMLKLKVQLPANEYPFAKKKKPVEKDVRRRIVVEKIVKVILNCEMPSALLLASSVNPERLSSRMGSGKRLSTLEGKLREYNRMNKFLQTTFGVPWPKSVIQLLDYLLDLADLPAGPTVPPSVLSMIAFFEKVGSVRTDSQLSVIPIVKSTVDDLVLELSSNKPRERRKAVQLLVPLIASWELVVTDATYLEVTRVQFWVRLVKLWGALRTSDQSGIPAKSLVYDGQVLSGKILVSKTTGAGKKVGTLTFVVSNRAWFLAQDWLEVGWDLFSRTVDDRTFLLPLPSRDRGTFSSVEPDFAQASITSRKILSETLTFSREGLEDGFEHWSLNPSKFLMCGMQIFWSLHSERNTVNTWATMLKVEKSRRDMLGRWKPEESDVYARNSRIVICEIQEQVCHAIKTSGGEDIFGEELVVQELRAFALKRGMEETGVFKCCDELERCRKLCSLLSEPVPPQSDDDLVEVVEGNEDQDVDEPPGGWPILSKGARVVSLTKGEGERTLHVVGKCWRVPGVHYSKFCVLDDEEVGEFSRVCKDCFPKLSEVSSSDCSTVSSDSSDSDESNA